MRNIPFRNCCKSLQCLLLAALYWYSHLTCSVVNAYSLPAEEYSALQNLYESTHGQFWVWKKPYIEFGYPWNFTNSGTPENPCNPNQLWQGITCSSSCKTIPCNVIQIDLTEKRMDGTLPKSIGDFSKLTVLTLPGNILHGLLPESIGNLTSLQHLALSENSLSRILPESLGNLQELQKLYLDSNSFTSTIPSSYGDCTALREIQISQNNIFGPIPSSFGNLTKLITLSATQNHLYGTIPESLGLLSNLQYLYLQYNYLSGTLPINLTSLTNIVNMDIYNNELTGKVPEFLSTMYTLKELALAGNHLTGTLPASLGKLQQLTQFIMAANQLTGTIPSSLGNLTNVQTIHLDENFFTGSIPESIGNWTVVESIFFDDNMLTNSLPASMGNCTQLKQFYAYQNMLSGTLPPEWMTLIELQNFNFFYNFITGSIPASYSNMAKLGLIDTDGNLMSGSIPIGFGNLESLFMLSLETNFMTGSLPSTIGNLQKLQILYLDDNMFSGSLTLLNNTRLILLYLDKNYFTGNLNNIILLDEIEDITLSNNQFSGSIPDSFFVHARKLVSAIMAINCFTGTLPTSICNATSLIQLSMDGLHSASSCSSHVLPWYSGSGLQSVGGVSGTIPECIWSMPKLESLTLSGNSLDGSISANTNSIDFNATSSLHTVILSNNYLVGSIPVWLESIPKLAYLDLSFNRIGGDLPGSLNPLLLRNGTLYVQDNRLSGYVPDSLQKVPHIQVLEGNIIGCKANRHDLPSHDPDTGSYVCGSDTTNVSLLIYGILIGLSILVVFTVFFVIRCVYRDRLQCNISSLWSKITLIDDEEIHRTFDILHRLCITVLILSILLFLPLFLSVGLSDSNNNTYLHRYVWQVSGLYLQGANAWAIVLLLALFILVGSVLMQLPFKHETILSQALSNIKICKDYCSNPHCDKDFVITTMAIVINVGIVLTINSAFVAAVVSNDYSITNTTIMSVALSLFKLIWNALLLDCATTNTVLPIKINRWTLILLSLFNNMVVPFLAEAFGSPNCFKYAVTSATPITVNAAAIECLINIRCGGVLCDAIVLCPQSLTISELNSNVKTFTYTPPFHYSYQCGSSLITLFVPVFIYRCILSGPIELCIQYLLYRYRKQIFEGGYLRYLKYVIPGLWRHLVYFDEIVTETDRDEGRDELLLKKLRVRLSLNAVTDLVIILSFGTFFPPLTWLLLLSICKDMVMYRVLLNRWKPWLGDTTVPDSQQQLDRATTHSISDIRTVSSNSVFVYTGKYLHFKGVVSELVDGLWLALIVSVLIWCLVLFDIVGNQVGIKAETISMVVVLFVSPWLLLGFKRSFSHFFRKEDVQGQGRSKSEAVELGRNRRSMDERGEVVKNIENPIFKSDRRK